MSKGRGLCKSRYGTHYKHIWRLVTKGEHIVEKCLRCKKEFKDRAEMLAKIRAQQRAEARQREKEDRANKIILPFADKFGEPNVRFEGDCDAAAANVIYHLRYDVGYTATEIEKFTGASQRLLEYYVCMFPWFPANIS